MNEILGGEMCGDDCCGPSHVMLALLQLQGQGKISAHTVHEFLPFDAECECEKPCQS